MRITLNNGYQAKFKEVDGKCVVRIRTDEKEHFADVSFCEIENVHNKIEKYFDKLDSLEINEYSVDMDIPILEDLPISIGCFETNFTELKGLVEAGQNWIFDRGL
jgi:hypothetical protein